MANGKNEPQGMDEAAKAALQTVKGRPVPRPAEREVAAIGAGEHLLDRVDNLVEVLKILSEGLTTSGKREGDEIAGFADHLQVTTRQFLADLLARRRRELADLERIVGKPTSPRQ